MREISTSLSGTTPYIKKDIYKVIKYCSIENISVEASNFEISGINSDTVFYHLEKLTMKDVIDFLEKSIDYQFRKFRGKKVILAIDFHDREYYGDRNDVWVVGEKYKNETNYFHSYVFLNKEDVVKELIERVMKYVEIELVMLDRGFFSGYVIRELCGLKVDFLMPVVNNRKIKKLDRSVYGYEMNGAKFNLIVKGKVKWATSLYLLPDKLTMIYKRRWRIETGYRKKKDFKIKTRTRNPVIRFLFFVIEILMYNYWMLVRNLPTKIRECCGIIKHLTTRLFKKKFLGVP